MSGYLSPYPVYVDSGLPWLGDIPSHWEVRRNGRLFAQRNQIGFPEHPILEVSLRTGVRVRDFGNSKRKQVMSEREKYKLAVKGDLAYNMMRMWQGAVGVALMNGLVSPVYVVARPRPQVDSRYYAYLFRTSAYMNEVDKYSHGIVKDRNRLYWGMFKQMQSAFPPREEQTTIADFLDHNRVLVQRFIRNKLRLIELLQEQKQNIINQAVTRGINSDVRFRPSGIDWLGEVPGHWEVKRFKNVCRLQRGYDLSNDKFMGGEYPVYGSNGVIGYHNSFTTTAPCITIGRSGSVGELNYIERNFWAHNTTLYVIDNFRNNWRYLFYLLRNIDLKMLSGGSAVPTLNRNYIHQLYMAIPPVQEQDQIVERIHSESSSLDAAIKRAESGIDLIREYRTRLIADVVTGKIDVRDIPVEVVSEDEALEEFAEAEVSDEHAESNEHQII